MKDPIKTPTHKILFVLGILVIALGLISIGMVIGFEKAKFSGHFRENFDPNFSGVSGGRKSISLPGGHGAAGEIVSVHFPEFTVSEKNNTEKVILLGTTTSLRKFQGEASTTDLEVGVQVVVLGNPNSSGVIEAKLIRIMPR